MARGLLGQWLIGGAGSSRTGGRIIETEAYLGVDDPASHAFAGRKYPGNRSIYGAPGTWYVYRSYGIHWCMNLVCGPPGMGAAILIRSILPELGLATMRARRRGRADDHLANGPGKLTESLGVDGSLDGQLMPGSSVLVRGGEEIPDRSVAVGPRVGISKAVDWPLRFRALDLTVRPPA